MDSYVQYGGNDCLGQQLHFPECLHEKAELVGYEVFSGVVKRLHTEPHLPGPLGPLTKPASPQSFRTRGPGIRFNRVPGGGMHGIGKTSGAFLTTDARQYNNDRHGLP